MSEDQGSQTLRHVPLEDRHEAAGARMVPFAGFMMPVQYEGIREEHMAVRQRVGLFDVSHMGEVEVRGPDAVAVVDGLVTNDVSKLADGQALYTAMCNEEGCIIDDLIVYRLASDHVLICVNASRREVDFAHMQAHARGAATLEDTSDQYIQLALQGPRAEALLQQLCGGGTELSKLRPFRATRATVAGVDDVLVARTGYTGEDGFELYIGAAGGGGARIFDALVEHGADHGLALCGLGARDTLRLEAKYLLYGQDITEETNPLEAGLGWVTKLDKETPFVGQQALRLIKEQGVSRRLRGLRVIGRGVIRPGYEIRLDGQTVGQVTSGSYSPLLETSIGMGYIDAAHAGAEEAEVEVRGRPLAVEVTRKAFYERDR